MRKLIAVGVMAGVALVSLPGMAAAQAALKNLPL